MVSVDDAFPCDGVVVVVVAAPAGSVAAPTAPMAMTATADRRVRTRDTCKGTPRSVNTDEARLKVAEGRWVSPWHIRTSHGGSCGRRPPPQNRPPGRNAGAFVRNG